MKSIFFNAHHSPVGAFSSFTLGYPGGKGGLGMELGGPANESVFIGLERNDGRGYEALPFFEGHDDLSKRYDVSAGESTPGTRLRAFDRKKISRDFSLGSDTWRAGDLSFSIYSAPKPVPEPGRKTTRSALQAALVPAVFAELTIDNRKGKRDRKAFFGYRGSNPFYNMRRLEDVSGGRYTGVGQGPVTAIVSDSPGVYSGLGFDLDKCLDPEFVENLTFGLGAVGALMAVVPRGKKLSFRFAICFYRDGFVTSGLPSKYFYSTLFSSIEEVAAYSLGHWEEQKAEALAADARLRRARLSDDQKFQLAHAVRSYYGATEMLVASPGGVFWGVNEGEYRMINTFDLTVDHLFFEMDQNPWVVRNQLDWFVRRYSYTDRVRLPGDPVEYPGGISFTHDMGVGNCFSRPGYSSYEQFGLSGCFSHMTHEQLVNWVCCAVTYVLKTDDTTWLQANRTILQKCLTSLVNRDHPEPGKRDGVMSADSSRCLGGAEITTYDSLDASLGQARNNLYLAVKTWAAYLGLEKVFAGVGDEDRSALAGSQSRLCAETIISHWQPEGYIPAVMGEGNESRIIPAIEGLVFPLVWGMAGLLKPSGKFAALGRILGRHFRNVLVPGVCKFADGGWKLSSTNDNSWLSKIYLCQFVARELFGLPSDPAADAAHRAWLLDPENAYFAWSDQMVSGKARGSKYYPRGVTSWLWLGGRKVAARSSRSS
ncbi:MAG: hypothetical protein Fur0032_15650 [Terrimicrobiaceae bacterium]